MLAKQCTLHRSESINPSRSAPHPRGGASKSPEVPRPLLDALSQPRTSALGVFSCQGMELFREVLLEVRCGCSVPSRPGQRQPGKQSSRCRRRGRCLGHRCYVVPRCPDPLPACAGQAEWPASSSATALFSQLHLPVLSGGAESQDRRSRAACSGSFSKDRSVIIDPFLVLGSPPFRKERSETFRFRAS